MTGTTAKTLANLRNAARSTGPKSPGGKARAAQNARRHGLSLPVVIDQQFGPMVEPLARAIAGPDPDPARLMAATRIAEAELDLMRVRRRRDELIQEPLLPRGSRIVRRASYHKLSIKFGVRVFEQRLEPARVEPWDAAHYFRRDLIRLERYERRALSRRKTAIRAFDALIAARVAP